MSSWLFPVSTSILLIAVFITTDALKEDANYWRQSNENEILLSLNNKPIEGAAKNVILFLGDGMGVTTVTAARIFKGQQNESSGEEGYLTFDRFPNVALLKTYNVDRQVPDSAATATAFLTGVKANIGTVGVDANVKAGDCRTYSEKFDTNSFLMEAVARGKSVGLVTTTRVTHATPAGVYAHSPSRSWESDTDKIRRPSDIPEHDQRKCPDIAQQLVVNGFPFKVIMGGGRRKFLPKTIRDPVNRDLYGDRSDRRNLIQEWRRKHRNRDHRSAIAFTATRLRELDLDRVDYLLGLFSHDHMEYDEDRKSKNLDEPSLTEMTSAALEILKRNPKGFVLLVEGGRIDHGHHESKARNALSEAVAFDKAVAAAMSATSERDTLIMVTADHSHVFTMGTYPSRGNNILGKTDFTGFDKSNLALDLKPVTTLLYANGPNAMNRGKDRPDETNVDTTVLHYRYQSLIPLSKETHGGEDVAIFARGPWSHLFQRVHEQTMVAQVARYAACLPPYVDRCSAAQGTY